MKLLACSVHDNAVEAFLPPFFVRSEGEAKRAFVASSTGEGSRFAQTPNDFTLFVCGSFDDNSGVFTPYEPKRLMGGLEVLAVLREEADIRQGAIGGR